MPRGFKDQVSAWIAKNIGRQFESIQDLAEQCANDVDCSSVTSRRLIDQLSTKNGPYLLLYNEDENVKPATREAGGPSAKLNSTR